MMIFKNLLRRKARTFLTILGISFGVAAIIALSVMTSLLENGYTSMMTGSKADLVLSQPNTFDINYSSVDEKIGERLESMPEVDQVSAMLQGIVQTRENPLFFIFGYPQDSYILSRFQIVAGEGLENSAAEKTSGKPLLLGTTAADALGKQPGDTLHLGDSLYRIIGVYQTGDAFEDRGAVLLLRDAQSLLDRPQKVSLYYIQLKNANLRPQLERRVTRLWDDLSLSSTDTFANRQSMVSVLKAYVIGISGLAILIGGVGMANAQLMSVYERTSEIGVLRALGWSRFRVMRMIISESLLVSMAGGVMGIVLGSAALTGLAYVSPLLRNMVDSITIQHIILAFSVVISLGLVGGAYPAWRASRMQPIDALRYEGGTSSKNVYRIPYGGLAVQSLSQRSARTLLTLSAIGITVGAVMALEGVIRGMAVSMASIATGSGAEIMIRERDATSSSLSSIDERIVSKIATLPNVAYVSRMVLTAVTLPDSGSIFMLQGLSPNENAIRRIQVVEGNRLVSSRQILLGRIMAEALKKVPGDTIELSGSRFKIVGIFETGLSWEEMGGVVNLRDAQSIMGQPRKVTMVGVEVNDPTSADRLVERINQVSPSIRADLTGEFVEQLPDMKYTNLLLSGISILAIFIGGLAVMNTMLMAVLERTREIGLLRAVGWRQRRVLSLILKEALLLGIIGGLFGILFAFLLTNLMGQLEMVGAAINPIWAWDGFLRAILIALLLGIIGGMYPAFRATRFQPYEALRYE